MVTQVREQQLYDELVDLCYECALDTTTGSPCWNDWSKSVVISRFVCSTPVTRSPSPSARHFALLERITPHLLKTVKLSAELFQLSPAEHRLAELLAQGLTLEGCAVRLNVSINTVRTQLRALFRKTGTTRQVQLINLFTRLIGG